MRTIVHLSDLHFGRVDKFLLKPLIEFTEALRPHLIVVSGDLTQRAKSVEFKAARAFLDALPSPQIVVPGNHDVPLYNVLARFARPLTKYRRYITDDLEPFYADDEIAALGLNTARSLTFKDGRLGHEQIARIETRMCSVDESITKLIVTHHPFDFPQNSHHQVVVGRAQKAMAAVSRCGVDVILSGHLHVSHIGQAAERFQADGRSTLIVQAGTATSVRARGEPNAFNVLRVDKRRLTVEQIVWNRSVCNFVKKSTEIFDQSAEGWTPFVPAKESPGLAQPNSIAIQP
ncbi:MAG TPA: metallophosphoesterase family protein [Polyangiaceae bacterium]|nr:metallophosphoesterase family protein [Polyangiaceae bacterium]